MGRSSKSIIKNSKKYRLIDGIKRYVQADKYVKNFSYEWSIHKTTQLDNEYFNDSENNFNKRFGLKKSFWKNKNVLDVGVGVGRYAQVALKYGANVYGIDLSLSVEEAKKNLIKYKNFEVIQADITDLPFNNYSFDVIYSFGVLHHTPKPKEYFSKLIKLLKKDGMICITVYDKSGMYHTSRYVRKITTKINPKILYFLTTLYTLLFYIPYRFLGLRYTLIGRLIPISLSNKLSESILDTYDCYSPKYQNAYDVHEIFRWFEDAGLKNIRVMPQPVTILGYKK